MLLASIQNEVSLKIIEYLAKFIALMFVLTLHEFSHAYVALLCGDRTAKYAGRCSINPFQHFDILGLLCFMICGFGWAKPVPINPYNFKNRRKGCILVSIAGVTMNFLQAFLLYPLFFLSIQYLPDLLLFDELIIFFLTFSVVFGLSFCVFNLLPLYPLDGFNLIDSLVNRPSQIVEFLRKNGRTILLVLLFINILSDRIPYLGYFDILGYVLSFATGVLLKPITLFWGLVF